ncbi:MAG: hypothetical protein ACX931_12750 [Saccharospirillum sp.]
MAKKPPKWLTRRAGAHRLLSWLAALQIRWQGYQDVRRARKAQRKHRKPNH